MIAAEDERHGTTKGHAAGCRDLCCRRARNDDEARRRKYRQVLGITRSTDATGTRRRIHALMAIGWTSNELAKRCGWTHGNAILEIASRNYVYATTAETIATLYNNLCLTPGPSNEARIRAARKGWASPLCWTDIDDPDERPAGQRRPYAAHYDSNELVDENTVLRILAGEVLPANKAERFETMRRWISLGNSQRSLTERMGWQEGRYTQRGEEIPA